MRGALTARSLGHDAKLWNLSQPGPVDIRDLPATGVVEVEVLQTDERQSRHDRVSVVLVADHLDVVAPRVRAGVPPGVGVLVDTHPAELSRAPIQVFAREAHHPAVGRRQVLDRLERVAGDVREVPRSASIQAGTRHVRSVENQRQAVLAAEVRDGLQLPGAAAHSDEDHRPGARPDALHQGLGVQAQELVDVGEHRSHPHVLDRLVGGDEGQRRRDDLIAVLPAPVILEHLQGHVQSRRAAVQEVSMRQPGVFAPLTFDVQGLEAQSRPAPLEALPDRLQTVLGAEIGDEHLDGLHEADATAAGTPSAAIRHSHRRLRIRARRRAVWRGRCPA